MRTIKVFVANNEQILQYLVQTVFGSEEVDMQITHQQEDIYQADIIICNLSQKDMKNLFTQTSLDSPSQPLFDLQDAKKFHCGDLEVDFSKRSVYYQNTPIHLTPTEFDLLTYFVQHQGEVLKHGDLLEAIREDSGSYNNHLIRVHVSNLRQKIEADTSYPHLIQTVPGLGYRFVECGELKE